MECIHFVILFQTNFTDIDALGNIQINLIVYFSMSG